MKVQPFAGPIFLCRTLILISITIPIYPQLASLSLLISIGTSFFFFTFAWIPLHLKSGVSLQLDASFPIWTTTLRCLSASWLYSPRALSTQRPAAAQIKGSTASPIGTPSPSERSSQFLPTFPASFPVPPPWTLCSGVPQTF